MLLDVHDAYEDARAGGDTLEEAARKQRLTPVVIESVDRTAQTPEGEILRDLPQSQELSCSSFQYGDRCRVGADQYWRRRLLVVRSP